MSVRVTLACQVNAVSYQELITFLEVNLPNVRGFKGNLQVSVLFDRDNAEMLLEEEWLTVENHQLYLKFIDEKGVLSELNSFLNSPPQIKYFVKKEI